MSHHARPVARTGSIAAILAIAAASGAAAGLSPAAASPVPSVHRIGATLTVVGTPAADQLLIRVDPERPDRFEIDLDGDGVGDRSVTRSGVRHITVRALAGRDSVVVDEGPGTIIGSASVSVVGGRGADTARIVGTASDDDLRLEALGDSSVLRRTAGNPVVLRETERVAVSLGVGADTLAVGDLATTDLVEVLVGLGAADPTGIADVVSVVATAGDDAVTVRGAGHVDVSGLVVPVRLDSVRTGDELRIGLLEGNDSLDATELALGPVVLTADGGPGNDTMLGGPDHDRFVAGPGDDVVFAGLGDNVAFGGDGDDTLRGESGDDTLDGGNGDDILIGGSGDDVLLNGEVVFDD